MRNPDPAFYAALVAAPEKGIVPRSFVTFTGRSFPDGAGNTTTQRMSFWSGDPPITTEVINSSNGLPSSRLFYGGVDLQVGEVPSVSTLTVQTVSVSMTANADPVALLTRGLDIRLATVEIWDGLLDPRTRLLVSRPELAFLGLVDGAPIVTEAIGGGEAVEFRVIDDLMMMLTRTNTAKSSDETQKKRLGPSGEVDEFSLYAASSAAWKVAWGEK